MTTVSEIPELRVPIPEQELTAICQRLGVSELAVFGSALTDDFTPDSDVDFMVSFIREDFGPWGCKLTELQEELSVLLGRAVDVVSRGAVQRSPNYIRRENILRSARTLYVS